MNFQDWINATPQDFPKLIDALINDTECQNPLIGNTPQQTGGNIKNMLNMLIQSALPKYPGEKISLFLDENATWAYIYLLHCVLDAATFECQHSTR
jgi:hypothetical protein